MVVSKQWLPGVLACVWLITACHKEDPGKAAMRAADSAELNKAQREVMEMYEAMVAVMPADAAATDCEALAGQFQAIAERNDGKLLNWAQRMNALSAEQRAQEEARFAQASGSRMKTVQEGVRRSVELCHGNPSFMGVIAKLGTLTPPS